MRFPTRPCLLLLAAGLCAGASATNIYQWKDAKGVTHSSDKPPAGQQYDTRQIQGGAQAAPTAQAGAPATSAAIDPQCAVARQNLKALGSGVSVMRDADGDGRPETPLSDEERVAQKNLAEAGIKAYCPPGG